MKNVKMLILAALLGIVMPVSLAYAADADANQPVRLNDGTNDRGFAAANPLTVQISDTTDTASVDGSGNLNVILAPNSGVDVGDVDVLSVVPGTGATNLGKAEDAAHATGDTGVQLLAVQQSADSSFVGTDGDYSPLQVNASGALKVEVIESVATGSTEYNEDDATPATIVGSAALIERDDALTAVTPIEGDWIGLRGTAEGALWTQDFNSDSMDTSLTDIETNTDYGAVTGGGVEASALRVTIASDSTGLVSVDDNGGELTVDQATHDNLNANANLQVSDADVSTSNPVPVQEVEPTTSANEVHDYNTAASIASGGTSNHDYTVTGTTFFLKSITVTASRGIKAELQTGPLASLTTDAVIFTSPSNPTFTRRFDPPIEVPVTSTGTVRIIRTNRALVTQDVYSVIEGYDV